MFLVLQGQEAEKLSRSWCQCSKSYIAGDGVPQMDWEH
jgi:hypothetical protein